MLVNLVFAGRVARSALHVELRQYPDQGRADPRRWRRLDHGVRRARLRDAGLARPGQAAIAQSHRARRNAGAAGPERTGRIWRTEFSRRSPTSSHSRSQCARSAGCPIPTEFGNIVVKQTGNAVVRVRDVARVELTGQDYSSNSYLDDDPSVALAVFQRPGSNALTTGDNLRRTMGQIAQGFSAGTETLDHLRSDAVRARIRQRGDRDDLRGGHSRRAGRYRLFLQTWRAAVIPIVAIPVSLVGTFFFMGLFGFSINNLSLFGLGPGGRHRGR